MSSVRAAGRGRQRRGRGRPLALAVALALSSALLAACGGESSTPTLNWYINPDNGGQDTPRREVRRRVRRRLPDRHPDPAERGRPPSASSWSAGWPPRTRSIDLMSLDPPFVAEFANAGFLRPITDPADEATFTDGVLEGPLETAYWNDQLVATPFWANTQLLWYRKSVAEAAGVDPTAPDFTWDEMIEAAESPGQADRRAGPAATRATWCGSTPSSPRPAARSSSNAEAGKDATPDDRLPGGRRGGRDRRRPRPVPGRATGDVHRR